MNGFFHNVFLVCILAIVAAGCGKYSKTFNADTKLLDTSSIKIGMTYDEVEKKMGRPTSIEQGTEEIDYNHPTEPEIADLAIINRCTDSSWYKDPARLSGVPRIYKAGVTLYVSWLYENDEHVKNYFVMYSQEGKGFGRTLVDITYVKAVVFGATSGKVAAVGYRPRLIAKRGEQNL